MASPLEDLAPKPFKDVESLFRGIRSALEVWGKIQGNAVLRVSFNLNTDMDGFEDTPSGWILTAKVEGFGDLTLEEGAERVNVDELNSTPLFSKEWEGRGATLQEAGEKLRQGATGALEQILTVRASEVALTEQTLTALRSGVTPEDLWGDPAQAEVSLEVAVSKPD